MDIQLTKLEIIEWITQISDINIISKMDNIRKTYLKTTKNNLKPMSLEEFYASIDKAEDDIKNGRVFTQKEVEAQSENW